MSHHPKEFNPETTIVLPKKAVAPSAIETIKKPERAVTTEIGESEMKKISTRLNEAEKEYITGSMSEFGLQKVYQKAIDVITKFRGRVVEVGEADLEIEALNQKLSKIGTELAA